MSDYVVAWRPQSGPQMHLLTCPVFEVFFGGARGGGKTDGVLGDWISHAGKYGKHANGLMVRRQRTELTDTVRRSQEIYGLLGWQWREQDHVWISPDGARLRMAYLERDADAMGYQGHGYTRIYVEEIGNFPSPAPIMRLMAALRSAHGVPVGFRATGNPGGPGHQWVKARYIDPAPLGYSVIKDAHTGLERVYIPSRLADNRLLTEADPDYRARLQGSGSAELVRAWLEGDWDVVAGAFFPEFSRELHVIQPFNIPEHWTRFRAGDWGSARPFSIGWYAVSDGDDTPYPRGALIRYREWYGCASPNVGLRMPAEEVADGIALREAGEKIQYGALDPAAFASDGGPSIAERMLLGRSRVLWDRADNKRTGTLGAMGGWDQVRARLKGVLDDKPMLYIFSTCTHLIRTLPVMQHDDTRPEDMDTEGEDHAVDELRYACMSRPYVKDAPDQPLPRWPTAMTINDMIKRQMDKMSQEA